ncbi:MAG: hypothetical protein IAE82_11655 [Opitutaceae bacterium]|nr:hypothetical protein [Opitutaceae bacterium]
MRVFRIAFAITLSCVATLVAPARVFTVAVYNVENLFDIDGVSLFDEYQPETYGPQHLARKLENISRVLQRFNGGDGPDIAILSEIEADQTPDTTVDDVDAFLKKYARTKARTLLTGKDRLTPELVGVPAHVWLLKQLRDDRLSPYRAAVGRWRQDPTGHTVAQTTVVLTRFPIVEQRTHDTDGARGILEVVLEVDGHRLHVFNNHWKSGAGDPATEPVRLGNAQVLRDRLDEILRADPNADVILGGDFNSQYNQKQRYPQMPRTAMNDVLRSQGDELALQMPGGPDLYNLWFELPNDRRGSDVFRDEWGTLIQMLVTRGLYDFNGIQYLDNTFAVGAFPGLNADETSRRPVRWQFAGGGSGFSDHFPVFAMFRTVEDGRRDEWSVPTNPSRTVTGPAEAVPAPLPLESATVVAALPRDVEFRTAANIGKLFRVSGTVSSVKPFRLAVEGSTGGEIVLWVRDPAVRATFFGRHKVGDRIEVAGELGQYRGDWQVVIPDRAVPSK